MSKSGPMADYRELALQICREHPRAGIQTCALHLMKLLDERPQYRTSAGIHLTAHIWRSLHATKPTPRAPIVPPAAGKGAAPPPSSSPIAGKGALVLRLLDTSTASDGRSIMQLTAAEGIRYSGFVGAISRLVAKLAGPNAIVGEALQNPDVLAAALKNHDVQNELRIEEKQQQE